MRQSVDLKIGRVEITDELDAAARAAAFQLRHTVFIEEAGRDRPVETDEHDEGAHHFAALLDGTVVGTLRAYLLKPSDTEIKIGRVAVRQDLRGLGLGRALMEFACRWAFEAKYPAVYLHAEAKVAGFYEKLGFEREGEEFMEAGTGHVKMRLAARPQGNQFDGSNVVIFPTRFKSKLPPNLMYPIGAKVISDHLQAVPQVEVLSLMFWYSGKNYLNSPGNQPRTLLHVGYGQYRQFSDSSGPTWNIWVAPVSREEKKLVAVRLEVEGFARIRDWLVANALLTGKETSAAFGVLWDGLNESLSYEESNGFESKKV